MAPLAPVRVTFSDPVYPLLAVVRFVTISIWHLRASGFYAQPLNCFSIVAQLVLDPAMAETRCLDDVLDKANN